MAESVELAEQTKIFLQKIAEAIPTLSINFRVEKHGKTAKNIGLTTDPNIVADIRDLIGIPGGNEFVGARQFDDIKDAAEIIRRVVDGLKAVSRNHTSYVNTWRLAQDKVRDAYRDESGDAGGVQFEAERRSCIMDLNEAFRRCKVTDLRDPQGGGGKGSPGRVL